MSDHEGEQPEGVAPRGGVSRRKVVIAGALLAPVLLTMRVPTASAGGRGKKRKDKVHDWPGTGQSVTASCQPARSAEPGTPICDDVRGRPNEEWHNFYDEKNSFYDD
ncbi:MAG TPA: hypothetical protein PLL69_05190 [Gemmatimonadales bacterium]|nr:hypothetical protein [Gemmatimonadales bacterium]